MSDMYTKDLTTEAEVLDSEDFGLLVKFDKPFRFEGIDYDSVDLSDLENISAADMISVNKMMQRTSPGIDVMPEVSLEYALNLACKATTLPIEFFLSLPPKHAMKIKNRVMGFLFGSE